MLFEKIIILVFISAAFVFYTLAIFSERVKKELRPWMVYVFGVGFFCDICGTSVMFIKSLSQQINIHEFFGYLALLIMFLHFIWAILALFHKWRFAEYFHRFSVYAWGIWAVAFITGGFLR